MAWTRRMAAVVGALILMGCGGDDGNGEESFDRDSNLSESVEEHAFCEAWDEFVDEMEAADEDGDLATQIGRDDPGAAVEILDDVIERIEDAFQELSRSDMPTEIQDAVEDFIAAGTSGDPDNVDADQLLAGSEGRREIEDFLDEKC